MIFIGDLKDKERAQKLLEQLLEKNIPSEIKYDPVQSKYQIWIFEEKDHAEAHEIYRLSMGFGKQIEMPKEWELIAQVPLGFLTRFLMVFCILIFASKYIEPLSWIYDSFYYSEFLKGPLFQEIKEGQIWRLITPIFLHFSFIHILFNTLWLKDLGKLIEYFHGPKFLAAIILVSGLLSNFGQYIMNGPRFGGMSGVVYALLGLIWMNKTFNPKTIYSLPKADVVMMIVWFFLCAVGLIPQVANMAHAVGLSCGMLIGMVMGCRGSKIYAWNKIGGWTLLAVGLTGIIVFWELR